MNWSVLRLLFLHELKMLVRARRTVVMAIVLPAIIMPLMLYAQKYSFERRERLLSRGVFRYAITGESPDRIRKLINETRRELNREQGEDNEQFWLVRLFETTTADPQAALEREEIQFYIETLPETRAGRALCRSQ